MVKEVMLLLSVESIHCSLPRTLVWPSPQNFNFTRSRSFIFTVIHRLIIIMKFVPAATACFLTSTVVVTAFSTSTTKTAATAARTRPSSALNVAASSRTTRASLYTFTKSDEIFAEAKTVSLLCIYTEKLPSTYCRRCRLHDCPSRFGSVLRRNKRTREFFAQHHSPFLYIIVPPSSS